VKLQYSTTTDDWSTLTSVPLSKR